MTTQQTIKSTLKISTIVILTLGGIGMLFLCYYLTTVSLNSEYPQIAGLVLGSLFGVIGLFSILSLLTFETLEVDNEKLVVKSILQYPKKIIYLRDIISYNEIEKENKSGKWFDLTIFTQTGKYKISSSVISNYHQFKPILTKGKLRNTHSENLWQYKTTKYWGTAFIIIGSLFLFGFWNIYNNRDNEILPQQLTTIKVTVSNDLEIDRRKSSRWVNIKTKEFPTFVFELTGNSFYAANSQQFVDNVGKEDKIEIDILTDTYEKKLTKTKPLTFWDKTVNYHLIGVFGLRDKNQTYMTLDALNAEHKSDSTSWGFWLFVLVGLGITGSGIYFVTANKKPAANSTLPKAGRTVIK
jgi:hypothetical protein